MREELTIIGSNVSAYATADAAARAGHAVTVYAPRQGDGAGFRSLAIGGGRQPLGFRVLELVVDADHPRRAPRLEDYTIDVAGHRDYLGLLHEWFAELLGGELRQLEAPTMWCGGAFAPDIYYTLDAVGAAAALRPEQRATVAREATGLVERWGAAGSLADPLDPSLWDLDLRTASLRSHGPTFHRLFVQSVCDKVFGHDGRDVPTPIRRKAWMPLFWPRTVAEVCSGIEPAWRPTHRRFHDCGGLDPVRALRARIDGMANVRWIDVDRIEQVAVRGPFTEVRFGDGRCVRAERPLLAVQPETLFGAAGIDYTPERTTSVLTWLEIAEDDLQVLPSVVMVVDPDVPAFRISTGGIAARPGHRLVTVELRHDVAEDAAPGTAAAVLRRLGIVGSDEVVHCVGAHRGLAFTAPTGANHRRWAHARSRFDELGSRAELLGGAASYGADSLNEQVIQGLAAAARHGEVGRLAA